jgi:hypothetical protein
MLIQQANAPSGGNGFNPLDDGSYRLHLDIRGDESTDQANADGTLKPFFGIQKVRSNVVDDNVSLLLSIPCGTGPPWGLVRHCIHRFGGKAPASLPIHDAARERHTKQHSSW